MMRLPERTAAVVHVLPLARTDPWDVEHRGNWTRNLPRMTSISGNDQIVCPIAAARNGNRISRTAQVPRVHIEHRTREAKPNLWKDAAIVIHKQGHAANAIVRIKR